jgi:hypothetical protein
LGFWGFGGFGLKVMDEQAKKEKEAASLSHFALEAVE